MSIGVVLNHFRRPENIRQQVSAIYGQSVAPADVRLWYNNGIDHKEPVKNDLSIIDDVPNLVFSYRNLGVWSRFFHALSLNTEFIAIFDDDTIPGKHWFKNCLESMEEKEGIYGSAGIKLNQYPTIKYYFESTVYDTNTNYKNINIVDYVGHAWFFKREWLWPMFKYPIKDYFCGEDMTLSFAAKKELGINTYVPPQFEENKDYWGSLYQNTLGTKKAHSNDLNMYSRYADYLIHLKNKYNWNFIYEKQNNP